MRHPFIVGERYFDRRGEYMVTRLDGGQVTYRYDDGTEKTDDIEPKARIYTNILAEECSAHPHQSSAYFWSLGFLARYAELQAEVPPQAQASFEEHYLLITGTRPILHQQGYYPIQIRTTYDKWGPELRIYFPAPGRNLELPPQVEIRPGNAPELLRINNNTFWWALVRIGFRLGTHHQTQLVRRTLPTKYQADFDGGFEA